MSNPVTIQSVAIDTEIEDFLLDRQVQRVSPNTIVWHKRCLGKWRAYSVEHFAHTTEQATPKLLRAFVAHLEAVGHNEGGISNIYGSVKAFLLWYEKEYEPTNWRSPTRKVKVRVPKPPLLEPVSLEHFRTMAATCEVGTFTGCRDLALLFTLLDSGMRHQELTDLTVDDINLSTGEILIRSGKGGKSRIVFVGATARQAIERYFQIRNGRFVRYLRQRNQLPETSALWLTEQGAPLTMAGIRQIVFRRAKQAGVPRYGLHAFRRAFAINSLRNGMDVITLQRLMGHSSLEVTTRYLKFVTSDLASAHAKFGVIDNLPDFMGHSEDMMSRPHSATTKQASGRAHKKFSSKDRSGVASNGEIDAKQQHKVQQGTANRPVKRRKPTAKAKQKRPPMLDYNAAVNEGKRPAKLHL